MFACYSCICGFTHVFYTRLDYPRGLNKHENKKRVFASFHNAVIIHLNKSLYIKFKVLLFYIFLAVSSHIILSNYVFYEKLLKDTQNSTFIAIGCHIYIKII